jgi:hypothetical protein
VGARNPGAPPGIVRDRADIAVVQVGRDVRGPASLARRAQAALAGESHLSSFQMSHLFDAGYPAIDRSSSNDSGFSTGHEKGQAKNKNQAWVLTLA